MFPKIKNERNTDSEYGINNQMEKGHAPDPDSAETRGPAGSGTGIDQ